jgi:hypothetical protein
MRTNPDDLPSETLLDRPQQTSSSLQEADVNPVRGQNQSPGVRRADRISLRTSKDKVRRKWDHPTQLHEWNFHL